MTVTIFYRPTGNAHFEKEVPDGATYDDIIKSVTLEDVINANVCMHNIHKVASWRDDNHPRIYHLDGVKVTKED